MPRSCELTGLGILTGNKVSHSKRKTRRKFLPNLQQITLFSEALGQSFRLKIAVKTLRTVDFKGGLDGFLLSSQPRKLTTSARSLRAKVVAALEKSGKEQEQKVLKSKVKESERPKKRIAKKAKAKADASSKETKKDVKKSAVKPKENKKAVSKSTTEKKTK
ncbi:MAG: 50S ribosomal protein L28 [Alphaproteobacteria bacterium]|nr:50S ribosomal protein L28 [Alphaproteobacteria bacterium]